MGEVSLRDVEDSDLAIFYSHQADQVANDMAAFPARSLEDLILHWRTKVLPVDVNYAWTILWDGEVAGNIVSWPQEGVREIGYWIGQAYWGQGIATRALELFLQIVDERPLYAHVVKHNVGSIRVLEKCGFKKIEEGAPSETDGFVESILRLDGPVR